MKKRQRRIDRKKFSQFLKDHCWGWRPPMKLRKIKYTDADIEILYKIRACDIEAGRKRMVARGLRQYAKPGETGYEEHKKWKEEEVRKWNNASV